MTDVLVDDYTKNLKEWPVFGDAKFGRAVKLLNGINGNNGTWTGIFVVLLRPDRSRKRF